MNGPTAESLIEKYGHLLTQDQLAEVLKRKVGGLRWSLSQSKADPALAFLRKVERTVGRRKYYPAVEVAKIVDGTFVS